MFDPRLLSVWGGQNYFSILILYTWFGVLLKDMDESFLLSKDEPLILEIDGVVALLIFRRRE